MVAKYTNWVYHYSMKKAAKKVDSDQTQQDFLRDAMEQLGFEKKVGYWRDNMGKGQRELMSQRMGVPISTFNKWMTAGPHGSKMSAYELNYVREIIAHEKLKVVHQRLKAKLAKKS